MHPRCCRPATSWVHYTTSCNTQSSAHEDGQNNCPKHVELTGIINKPLFMHLVGCLYYLYQWCTVKQISDNEIYLLIKYIKSFFWRVAKRLSYVQDARFLKVKLGKYRLLPYFALWSVFFRCFLRLCPACQRQACTRVSPLSLERKTHVCKWGCPTWKRVASERAKRTLWLAAATKLVCPLLPGRSCRGAAIRSHAELSGKKNAITDT